jgi:hypothetical protein
MKFRMLVRPEGAADGWWEDYDKTCTDARAEAQSIVDYFNKTLRRGERPRVLLDVQVLDEQPEGHDHDWEKVNAITITDRLGSYDRYQCRKCGITGRRFGLADRVTIDRKFKAKLYLDCRLAAKKLRAPADSI